MKFSEKPAWRESRRFFRVNDKFRLLKRNPDFAYIGEVDFNGNMLFPADFLRAVNYDSVNQFIYRRSVKLLQIGISIGKLKEAPHIGDLSRLILNLLFQ